MDNDIMGSISEMLGSMSEEDMQQLREAAQSMLGGAVDSDSESKSESKGESPFSGIDPEMISKISRIMSAMNKKDNRSDFIAALKPHLSKERQKKADDAMQMLKLMDLLPMLQDGLK